MEPLVASALRARLVGDPTRFLLREATNRRVAAMYTLREAPEVTVVLRHRTPDIEAFDEIFSQRIYVTPAPVEEILNSLGRPPRVADLGANVGLFGAWIRARWAQASIVSFEPDPFNLPILERTVAANGGDWRVFAGCAWTETGSLPFQGGQFALSHAVAEQADPGAAGVRVQVPAQDVFPTLARVDLAKLDIEGSEWPILTDPRFKNVSVPTLTLEYHPQSCPEPLRARAVAMACLENAGYMVQDVPTQAPPGYGSLWAWRAT